jgi:hypothetical protein
MAFAPELLDQVLEDYQQPEDKLGPGGILDQLKKALMTYTESGGQGDATFDTAQAIAVTAMPNPTMPQPQRKPKPTAATR